MKTMTFGNCPAYQEVQGNKFLELLVKRHVIISLYGRSMLEQPETRRKPSGPASCGFSGKKTKSMLFPVLNCIFVGQEIQGVPH